MTKLPTTPYNTRLGFTVRSQVARFVTNQPRPLPALPQPVRKLSRSQRVLCLLLTILVAPLLFLGFLVVGELPHLKR